MRSGSAILFFIIGLSFSYGSVCPTGDAEFFEAATHWNEPFTWTCPPFGRTTVVSLIDWINNSCECQDVTPALVSVDEGWFWMGCGKPSDETYDPECGPDSKVRNHVWLPTYEMGQFEVTFYEYDYFIEYGGEYLNERTLPDDEGWGRDNRPVININQYDMYAFCNWLSHALGYDEVYLYDGPTGPTPLIPLVTDQDCGTDCHDAYPIIVQFEANGFRLPTEAEWMKAARGGCDSQYTACDDRSYPWGSYCFSDNSASCTLVCPYENTGEALFRANYWPGQDLDDPDAADRFCSDVSDFPDPGEPGADTFPNTAPIGSFSSYPSAYGCMDMAGNVSEFTQGWYWDGYGNQPEMCDPKGPVTLPGLPLTGNIMGGDWQSSAWQLLLYNKASMNISSAANRVGFRIMRRDTFQQDSCPELFSPPETELVPDGTFVYGCNFWSGSGAGIVTDPDCWLRSYYRHYVTISEYEIGTYELTFNEYDYFIEHGGDMVNGRTYPSPGIVDRDQMPVSGVNHYDAYAYCNWLSIRMGYDPVYTFEGSPVIPRASDCTGACAIDINWDSTGYRLPTHMEWQRAARGDEPCADLATCTQNKFPWGNECPDDGGLYRANWFPNGCGNSAFDCAWHAQKSCSGLDAGNCICGDTSDQQLDGFLGPAPVGSFPFPSGFGCYDMAGNLAEMVQDWYFGNGNSQYSNSTVNLCDPTGPATYDDDGPRKILTGGHYAESAFRLLVYQHWAENIASARATTGFRIARRTGPSVCTMKEHDEKEPECKD